MQIRSYILGKKCRDGEEPVWLGRSLLTGEPLRVKFIRSDKLLAEERRQALNRQIRLVGGLLHEVIAPLIDIGEFDPQRDGPFEGRTAGDFYLVSRARESETSLDEVLGELRWGEFSMIIVEILRGLAHGHARSVLHGSLHPECIGLCRDGEGRQRVRLYEFGHFLPRSRQCWSTTAHCFHAPELRQTPRSDWEPSSDIYSLGALVFRWLYGRLPDSKEGLPSRREQHFFVPAGLPEWIAHCLKADPGERFQMAADARGALESLAGGGPNFYETAIEDLAPSPVPAHWQEDLEQGYHETDHWWKSAVLFDSREAPLVGRQQERSKLWRALYEVDRRREARAVVINGSAGLGKVRLARWLEHRAAEVGAARCLAIPHSLFQSTSKKLGSLLTGHLGGEDAEGEATGQDLVRLMARKRALIVRIDDAQWGQESMDWIEEILDEPEGLPILFVFVVHEESLADRPVETVQIEQMLQLPTVSEITLGGLTQTEVVELLGHLAPLDEDLAYEVAQRAEGSPLYVIQLLRDWVQRGVLEPLVDRPDRLGLVRGESVKIPEGFIDVWDQRLRHFIERFDDAEGPQARQALEVAAALGIEVDFDEWNSVCQRLDLSIPNLLVHGLFANWLVLEIEEGRVFKFAHTLLRETLRQWLRAGGRHERIHAACAEVLSETENDSKPVWPERLGVHLVEAGQFEAALDLLLQGAMRIGNLGDHRRALGLMKRYEEACDRLDLPQGDKRRILGWMRRAWSYEALGHADLFQKALEQARENLQKEDEKELLGKVLWLEAGHAFRHGQMLEVQRLLDEALGHFQRCDDGHGMATTYLRRGSVNRELGRSDEAEEDFGRAREIFERQGDRLGAVLATTALATVYRLQGRLHQGQALLQELLDQGHNLGPSPLAGIYNSLGEICRVMRDWDRAENSYRRALELWEELGDPSTEMVRINLGMTLVEQERYREAQDVLKKAEAKLGRSDLVREQIYALAALLPCYAAAEKWPRWSECAGVVESYVLGNQSRSPDLQAMFRISAELAEETAPPEIAVWARALYMTQAPEEEGDFQPEARDS